MSDSQEIPKSKSQQKRLNHQKKDPEVIVKKSPAHVTERQYSKEVEIDHDLFWLRTAPMKRNLAMPHEAPEYRSIDHQHQYHTVTSDGKEQVTSSSIGGHFHKMEVVKHEDGSIEAKCVSGPVRYFKVKQHGKWKKIMKPINDFDDHCHEVEYVKSDRIGKRLINAEAATVQAVDAQKVAPVAGVQG